MKTIYQLLILLKKAVQNDNDPKRPDEILSDGLCTVISDMNIPYNEKDVLSEYLDTNRPKDNGHGCYYWKEYKISPRIRWINKHIALNK